MKSIFSAKQLGLNSGRASGVVPKRGAPAGVWLATAALLFSPPRVCWSVLASAPAGAEGAAAPATAGTAAAAAPAPVQQPKSPPESRTSINPQKGFRTEFHLGLPAHIITTSAPGAAPRKSRSLVGFELLYRVCPASFLCPHLSYSASVDPNTGRRPLSGPSLGLHTFVLGSVDETSQDKTSSSTSADLYRAYLVTNFCQRDFDFRTAASTAVTKEQVSGSRVDGSLWAFGAGAGVEADFTSRFRIGFEYQKLLTQASSAKDFNVSADVLVLRFQLKGEAFSN